jgi:hypothetical protein
VSTDGPVVRAATEVDGAGTAEVTARNERVVVVAASVVADVGVADSGGDVDRAAPELVEPHEAATSSTPSPMPRNPDLTSTA